MSPVVHSERLTMTPTQASDVDITLEMFTDPEVLRYAGGPMSEEKIRSQMPNWLRRGGNGCIGIWCISDRETGEKYGSVALLPMPVEEKETDYSLVVPDRWPDVDVEVGYFLKRSAWGRGYATEACNRILKLAFEESPLTEVVATFDPKNAGSRHVLEKAGFVDHGMRRAYAEDSPDYRITREAWLERQTASGDGLDRASD